MLSSGLVITCLPLTPVQMWLGKWNLLLSLSPHVVHSCIASFKRMSRLCESLFNSRFFLNCVRFLNRTISSVVEQHLFSVNPTRGQSSGDSHLTPWPPASGVRTSARQRRRQWREQQEELLRRKEKNRYNERSTMF